MGVSPVMPALSTLFAKSLYFTGVPVPPMNPSFFNAAAASPTVLN